MTTVAWDGKTLAADRRVTGNVIGTTTKIRRLSDGRLVGATGSTTVCEIWMDWMESGCERPSVLSDKEDWIKGLEIMPDGRIFEHSQHGKYLNESEKAAVGSGSLAAMAAMIMGANAYQAVEIAALLDENTGNGVDALELAEN